MRVFLILLFSVTSMLHYLQGSLMVVVLLLFLMSILTCRLPILHFCMMLRNIYSSLHPSLFFCGLQLCFLMSCI